MNPNRTTNLRRLTTLPNEFWTFNGIRTWGRFEFQIVFFNLIIIGAVIGAFVNLADRPRSQLITVSYIDIVQTKLVERPKFPVKEFRTSEDAVIAASNRYNPDSVATNREHVGGVLHCQHDGFMYTHGIGKKGMARVQFSIPVPDGCMLDSVWHTHGGRSKKGKYFSPADTKIANSIHKPIYMADYEGTLRVYRPGDPKIPWFRVGTVTIRGAARGTVVRNSNGVRIRIATDENSLVTTGHASSGEELNGVNGS